MTDKLQKAVTILFVYILTFLNSFLPLYRARDIMQVYSSSNIACILPLRSKMDNFSWLWNILVLKFRFSDNFSLKNSQLAHTKCLSIKSYRHS